MIFRPDLFKLSLTSLLRNCFCLPTKTICTILLQFMLLLMLPVSDSLVAAGERVPAKLSPPQQSADAASVETNQAAPVLQEPLLFANEEPAPQYLADIQIHSSEALLQILRRVEELVDSEPSQLNADSPVVFLLHGKEARSLLQNNYRKNKELVDLAARLAAFEIVDIKVCEVWMGNQRLDKSQLQPFVGTIPFAPSEKKRLVEQQGYQYF